ncbi:LysR family transcriptional regulator [Variovorax ureilyticus]|uniref:LysR family transcriptional regulator n=1 Tax=Variovorax ureilyticus TaxID=1836198 RepID=A0ABU8VME4_9BURK
MSNPTRLGQLDLNLLTLFDALLREQSVTRAAEAVGVTQSAVSHALNRLRDFFDDPLFVKAPEGMVPTRKAEALKPAVVDIVAAIRQRILSEAAFDPATSHRIFTLCMTDMGELVFLPPLLNQFRALAPRCRVRTLQVPSEQIEGLLSSGEADLALGSIRTAPEGLYRQRLFMHLLVTIVSARNRQVGEQLTLQQFEQMPHVAVSLAGRPGDAYDSALEEQGIKRTIFLATPHFLTVPLLLEQQPDLIATVPLELANVFQRYGTVRVVQPPVELAPYALNQHWHPRFHHDPAVVWIRELVKKTFEGYPDHAARKGEAQLRQDVRR